MAASSRPRIRHTGVAASFAALMLIVAAPQTAFAAGRTSGHEHGSAAGHHDAARHSDGSRTRGDHERGDADGHRRPGGGGDGHHDGHGHGGGSIVPDVPALPVVAPVVNSPVVEKVTRLVNHARLDLPGLAVGHPAGATPPVALVIPASASPSGSGSGDRPAPPESSAAPPTVPTAPPVGIDDTTVLSHLPLNWFGVLAGLDVLLALALYRRHRRSRLSG